MTQNQKPKKNCRLSELSSEIIRFNDTNKNYPLDRTIISFFEEQANKTPDKTAVIFEGNSLTYAELNIRADSLALELIKRGIGLEDFVGVCMLRSLELVIALFGILKSGAAYVPFDPEYPQDRLDYMISNSEVSIVLTHKSVKNVVFPIGATVLNINTNSIPASVSDSILSERPEVHPDSAAYMIYTSGSTGKPKGAINIHRGLTNRILWAQETFKLTPDDCILQKTPFSFDVSVWEFFWPLITGATICIAAPGGHRDNAYLVDVITANNITVLHFVPSMLGLFLNTPGLNRLTSLRLIICSGEALPLELMHRFFEKLPEKKLYNLYGPTEASIDVTAWECKPESTLNFVPIGYPVANTQIYILDEQLNPLPAGETGDLYIGGVQVGRGYWKLPELTSERFIPDPFSNLENAKLYKTGDLARYLPDGAIEYRGRADYQIKLRGFRIELGEIEAALRHHPDISEAVVTVTDDDLEEKLILAYLVTSKTPQPALGDIKKELLKTLPEYMIPARFMFLEAMPLSPNGKIDRKALPSFISKRPELAEMYIKPRTKLEHDLCKIWQEVLNLDMVGMRDNFFDIGGNSLLSIKITNEIKLQLNLDIPSVKVFEFSSIEKIAAYLDNTNTVQFSGDSTQKTVQIQNDPDRKHNSQAIAITGMVGRFPGAKDLNQLWSNLINDIESISRFTSEELSENIDKEIYTDPNYVPCRGIIDDADKFDASFFGIGPLEAKVMDPQQRVFLELAWAALEEAGYDPDRFPGMIGMYAGIGDNHYYVNNVLCHPDLVKTVGGLIISYGNEKDYVATRASFHLNLTGPSVSANTGCSTSLLAVDNAVKALNSFECDMALAGGVDIFIPQKSGQIHQVGGTFTSDGHCRPFDATASGTMFCDGAGIVVLRRLEDAIASGDHIYAVVIGSAKNNDGNRKVSFLAPSVEGQCQVITQAQAQAKISADTISYVETHGTGTPLGDPIEFEALTKAFRKTTDRKQFCKLGSIKGHIGHPTIAAGVAGLIKTALSLHHEKIPSTLHFKKPNPAIDLENSPFQIIDKVTPWPKGRTPRRAAVSSFGFGGTNVHAILEDAPVIQSSSTGKAQNLFLFSAKTAKALDRVHNNFTSFLTSHPDSNIADIAYTLQLGRKHFAYRDFVVASDAESVIQKMSALQAEHSALDSIDPPVVFLFPGQGAQYVNMGRELYNTEPVFRKWMDRCIKLFRLHLKLEHDLEDVLYPSSKEDEASAPELLRDTGYTQPAIFSIEISLAYYWMSLGIQPSAVIGHSIGEFASACLSGVFSLEDAVSLVALRARLIRELPNGSMLSVFCTPEYLENRLPSNVQIAALNGPSMCVIAGPQDAIKDAAALFESLGVNAKLLHTSHAFHSSMMEPVIDKFCAAVSEISVSAPSIPFLSTSLAEWITNADQIGPDYWAQHIRKPVLFSDAISKAFTELDKSAVFLEVGPRDVLTTLTRTQAAGTAKSRVIASLGDAGGEYSRDFYAITSTTGRLWKNGVSINWDTYHNQQKRCRVSLPTYPFERTSYWLEPISRKQKTQSDTTISIATKLSAEQNPKAVNVNVPPIKGLRLGYNKNGRPMWLAQKNGQTDNFVPVYDDNLLSENPFAPPSRKVISATPAQQKIWNTIQSNTKSSLAFNDTVSIRLSGHIDQNALDTAIQGLPVLHEILRGHFTNDGMSLIIEPQVEVPVLRQKITPGSEEDIITSASELEKKESIDFYDLSNGPLIRVNVLDAGSEEHILIIGVHGSIIDGWSFDVLLQNFEQLYTAFAALKPPFRLPVHGFSDFVNYTATADVIDKKLNSISFWQQKLSPLPLPFTINYDKKGSAKKSFNACVTSQKLHGNTYSKVKSFANNIGVSFFSVLFAGFAKKLQLCSSGKDLTISTTFAGHPSAGMEDAVGRFVNIVPVRIQSDIDSEFSELCRYCHRLILESSSNTTIGFEEIFRELGFSDEKVRHLLDVRFTYTHKYSQSDLNFGNILTSYYPVNHGSILTNLEVNAFDSGDYLEFIAHCNADIASQKWLQDFISDLIEYFEHNSTIDNCRLSLNTGNSGPQNNIEKFLLEVWKQVIGISDINAENDFYELGGHSLLAVQIFNEVYNKYNLRLPLSILIEYNTIRKFAVYLNSIIKSNKETVVTGEDRTIASSDSIDRGILGKPKTSIPASGLRLGYNCQCKPVWLKEDDEHPDRFKPLDKNDSVSENPFTCKQVKIRITPAQEEILRLSQSDVKTHPAYNEVISVRMNEKTESIALDMAIEALPVMHEILRGHFSTDYKELVIEESISLPVVKHSIDAAIDSDITKTVSDYIKEFAKKQFDLLSGPLCSVTILTTGNGERIILITAHASIIDKWSINLIAGDLVNLYSSFSAVSAPCRLPLHTFCDYIRYRSSPEFTSQYQKSIFYWHSKLGLPPLPSPLPSIFKTRPNLHPESSEWHISPFKLHDKAVSQIRSFAKENCVSRFSVLLAAFASRLMSLSRSNDITTAVTFAGQIFSNMEDTAGVMTSLLPLRIRTSEETSFAGLCQICHNLILNAGSNVNININELANELGFSSTKTESLLATSITYIYEKAFDTTTSGLITSYDQVLHNSTSTDLHLFIKETGPYLELTACVKSDCAEKKWSDNFVTDICEVLTKNCNQTPDQEIVPQTLAEIETSNEKTLTDIWKRALDISDINTDSNFYVLGGDSISAIHLLNEISRQYKVTLPLSILAECNTVRLLSAYLQNVKVPGVTSSSEKSNMTEPGAIINNYNWNTVVAFRKEGTLPPFFCASGQGGNPMIFMQLSKQLGVNQPFYALQYRGVDGMMQPHQKVEDMAAEFISDMQKVQPKGPYYIGGYSFGGIVAYEMIRQLIKKGETIAGLVLIDTVIPSTLKWSIGKKIRTHISGIITRGPAYIIKKLKYRKDKHESRQSLSDNKQDIFKNRFNQVARCNHDAGISYNLQPIDTNVLFIKSAIRVPLHMSNQVSVSNPQIDEWYKYISLDRLDIRYVQTDHYDLLIEPHVIETARNISDGLEVLRRKYDSARKNVK